MILKTILIILCVHATFGMFDHAKSILNDYTLYMNAKIGEMVGFLKESLLSTLKTAGGYHVKAQSNVLEGINTAVEHAFELLSSRQNFAECIIYKDALAIDRKMLDAMEDCFVEKKKKAAEVVNHGIAWIAASNRMIGVYNSQRVACSEDVKCTQSLANKITQDFDDQKAILVGVFNDTIHNLKNIEMEMAKCAQLYIYRTKSKIQRTYEDMHHCILNSNK